VPFARRFAASGSASLHSPSYQRASTLVAAFSIGEPADDKKVPTVGDSERST
jgi:hypothetical protein